MQQDSRIIALIVGFAVLAGGGWLWWKNQRPDEGPAPPPPAPPAQAAAPAPPPPAPPAEPAIKHPVEPGSSERGDRELPPLADSDGYVSEALTKLFGRKSVLSFLHIDGFVRGFVATVDNLANERAQAPLWPVKATPGGFRTAVAADGVGGSIAPENAARYTPFVRFATAVDARKAAGLYRRMYPLFQQAYEELGYPGKYFNDRVVEVIDHLLVTPELAEPLKVKRVAGETPGGGFYQFDDPEHERRSAGQKILLRIGPAHAAALKAKLTEVRALITQRPPG